MKQPTDKDIRLYASLSDVDSQFILDSTIPLKAAPVPPAKKASKPTLWDYLRRPQYASVALAALLVTLTVVALLVTGITKGPQTEPPPHGIPTDPIGSVKIPTAEDAAALRKGMSFAELVSLMGNNYTQEGTRYTFTLDTGEQLTVSTAPNDGGEPTVTGFEWLGSAGKTYNPMGIPAEILQKVQDYATDRVIPVYAMSSLIGQYDSTTPPTLDEILKNAEVHYLRMGADGETALLDGEGHGAGGYMQGEAFSFLEDVSALFDKSVRVKGYYPILTSMERGAVYFQTSIGDYILYLHGEAFTLVPEGSELTLADSIPYLMPAAKFHEFAYGVVSDQKPDYGIGWMFSDKRLAVIGPYQMTAEGYQKPVNLATPEAAEQIKVGDKVTSLAKTLGACRRCTTAGVLYLDPKSGEYILPTPLSTGLHYWELTDGSGLVIYGDMEPTFPDSSLSSSVVYLDFHITYKERVDAAVLDDMGTPTVGTCALITEGMESAVAEALLGTCLRCAAEQSISRASYARSSVVPPTSYKEKGLHYWELTDGSCLAINCIQTYDATLSSDPYRFWVSDILRLDSVEQAEAFGAPSLANYALLSEGMSHTFACVIMGSTVDHSDPTTADWIWFENGETHTVTGSWSSVLWDQIPYDNVTKNTADSFAYESFETALAVQEITVGMSFESVTARLGDCLCGHNVHSPESEINGRYHFWTLSNDRSFTLYMGTNLPIATSAFYQRFTTTGQTIQYPPVVMDIQRGSGLTLGSISQIISLEIQPGMREDVVIALAGQPSMTVGDLVSAWDWYADGNFYHMIVYWNDNDTIGAYGNVKTVARQEGGYGQLPDIFIPKKEPTPDDAAMVTVGMSSVDALKIMGRGNVTTLGNAALYVWTLTDGRVFCAVAEHDPSDPKQGERYVTYTFYRDSLEKVSSPTPENMEAITEGMSTAIVLALLGNPSQMTRTDTLMWVTPEGAWWEIEIEFESVTNGNVIDYLEVKSFTLIGDDE